MRLEGKVAVITGSATGIGRACAKKMASEGAAVTIDYIEGQREKAEELVAQIESDGGRAVAVQANVCKSGDVSTLIETAIRTFSRIDVMVNNAGIEEEKPFVDMPEDVWHKVLETNLTGPFLCSQIAARKMIGQGQGGRIINISSVHEDVPMPKNIPYCAAKGGLRMFMRTAAVELAPHKITVNNIAPGAIDTPINKDTEENPKKMKALLEEIPLDRMGQPEEVAELAIYLASDAAAYVTGSTYVIDGGMMRHSKSL
jgi:glucose 1-dehydrogenase